MNANRLVFWGAAALAVLVTSPVATLAEAPNPKLLKPADLTEKAPETFRATFETTKGNFVIEVTRAWSPAGADRFYNLVKNGYYDGTRFYRVVPEFVVQWGFHGDPSVNAAWRSATIPDEEVKQGNKRGFVSYAKGGPNTRSVQLFVNLRDNDRLDGMGFPAFGQVVEGMKTFQNITAEYGEKPEQGRIFKEGNAYLDKLFPRLDYIKKATIVTP